MSKIDRLSRVHDTKLTFVGTAAGVEDVYYSTSLNQVYIFDNASEETKILTHEEYIDICDMRADIEKLAKKQENS